MSSSSQTLFRNGHVFDGHRLRRDWAVLVEGDRVLAAGDPDGVAEHRRPGADGRAR